MILSLLYLLWITDLYRDQLNSSALLYSETGDDSGMSAFWSKFAQFNGFQLEHYSGDFPDILELNLKVCQICF